MNVITEFPEVDQLLDQYRDRLGAHHDAYRNHVYRMMNFTVFLNGAVDSALPSLEVAGFFHDLDFILNGNGRYLEPSAEAARAYLDKTNRAELAPLVTELIVWHHKLTRYKGEHGALVEHFRVADLVDLSLGIIRGGVARSFIREVKAAFPNAGFHNVLAKNLTAYAIKHPFNPMPMVRA